MARYFAWLEEQLDNNVELNESQGADKLEEFRSYVTAHFVTILLPDDYPHSSESWLCTVDFRSTPSHRQDLMAVRLPLNDSFVDLFFLRHSHNTLQARSS